ncbi:ABC transporter ATP-binding protein [Aliidiomarina sedimenti]|uniref:ABC transporter ATP-binding protein n=1 Tax=Aliidiomarina sedimenti TaxID=1933879 RepID=A0ABY0C0C5_9GAMM|nr:ATP-binding cassette domain-containing protein [Aliidiomarina sedimenti]RUO30659.1 ABC transporter ATP-binding protein [Aliidiomarina sedimenti]
MIQADGLALMRGGKQLLQNSDFTIFPGHRVGLVGANGSGKSSLFALLRGELKEDAGTIQAPAGWQIASVAQETPALDSSALNYVITGDQEYTALTQSLADAEQANDGQAIARIHGQIDAIGGYQIEARAASLLSGLGFSQAQLSQPVSAFSGGWRMRLNLAQALIARSDLLLLDEPTNHLDLDAIYWLENWLLRYPGTLVLISHDRDFLDAVVTHTIHIERQQTQCYNGNYTSFQRQRSEKLAQQRQTYEKEQAQRAHLQKFVDRFKAQATKAKQAQSRVKALEKLTASAPIEDAAPFVFEFREPGKLPNPLMEMEKLRAGYGDTTILENIHLNLVPGSRIGLLGHNGAGKSTLMKLLAGELKPLAGERRVSAGLEIGYFAQHQLETLHPEESPMTHIQRLDPPATEQSLRDYLGSFGFHGDVVYDPTGPFSGGEKARLVLALVVYQRPNLLLLDEPTNHLDLDIREALMRALQSFTGAMVIVSHDRHFLRATVDDFYLVANQAVQAFDGSLEDYQRWVEDERAQQKAVDKEAQLTSNGGKTESTKGNKKEQRQAAADKRKQLKPVTDKVKAAEKRIQQAEQALAQLHDKLSDSELYEAARKDELTRLLQEQAQYQTQLDEAEAIWLEQSEILQALQSED